GAQLGQYPRAGRPCDELGDVEHAIARQHRQFGAHGLLAALIQKERLTSGTDASASGAAACACRSSRRNLVADCEASLCEPRFKQRKPVVTPERFARE